MANVELEKYKSFLPDYASKNLQKASKGSKQQFICPFCGSGSGSHGHGTPAFTVYPTSFKCFSCEKTGDIFDLAAEVEHLEPAEAIRKIKKTYGDGSDLEPVRPANPANVPNQYAKTADPKLYKEFFAWATANALAGSYWQGRGFTPEEITAYNLGEIPAGKIDDLKKRGTLDDLNIKYIGFNKSHYGVIPYGASAFTLRDIDKGGYIKQKGSRAGLFSAADLYSPDMPYCLVVEGEVDCLTIKAKTGLPCIATGSKSNGVKLIEQLEAKTTTKTILLLPDNDRTEAGTPDIAKRAAFDLLAETLTGKGYNAIVLDNTSWKYKDPNEFYQREPEELAAAVNELCSAAVEKEQKEKDRELDDYIRTSAGANLANFIVYLSDKEKNSCTPTGFKILDGILDGGLWAGELVTLGALSSNGKTTLALQMAVNMAAHGKDVLYFALEQSKFDLMAKSISSLTYELSRSEKAAQTCREVGSMKGRRRIDGDKTRRELRNKAEQEYSARTSGRLFIIDGRGVKRQELGTADIKEAIAKHIRLTGNTPVIFTDYLQLLKPADGMERATDKQITDKAITDLKDIAVDYNTTVVCISSFNRNSYNQEADMTSFKETGKIEFSSDTILALQVAGISDEGREAATRNKQTTKKSKTQPTRTMELLILKQRNGRTGDTITMSYEARFNYFTELSIKKQ
jgi:replicative DNA helicase